MGVLGLDQTLDIENLVLDGRHINLIPAALHAGWAAAAAALLAVLLTRMRGDPNSGSFTHSYQ